MSERQGRPAEPNPEIEAISEGRCPACESEDEIERIDHPQRSSPQSGRCTTCDHRTDPLAVRHSWDWERMTEDEHEQARRERERYESMIAEYQHSTLSLSAQCEP